ncbi:hypothetical protein LOC54_08745 [Acetobacter sp. AN02]|uniref:NUDIX hydrolase n=1 Tax=Acetobacter sp. AN02 TaxID=2894186 RepID=UPI0024343482|nr:hypothetical protein [Acetobacter sp. AN02]MDG6095190.1 hypothetical protein [Acetobacter sp. AN02]
MKAAALCETELVAVLVSLESQMPCVVTIQEGTALPSGPLTSDHRSLQRSLRLQVEQQTGLRPGHTEQLYTFTDSSLGTDPRKVRISYMACLPTSVSPSPERCGLYDYFPWEDRRQNAVPAQLIAAIRYLRSWAGQDETRWQRCAATFGLDGHSWNDELALARYELMWEAGLVRESLAAGQPLPEDRPMLHDHRRVLATALSRIRARIRYTPMVFDLLPAEFTLLQLQSAMEALAGRLMHKQNFRRLVLQQNLLSETDRFDAAGPGRPARLYRFRQEAAQDCYLAGAKKPLSALR